MERNAPDRLLTLTHARLRVAQGDLGGARAVLNAVIAHNPEDAEARRLLSELDGRSDGAVPSDGGAPPVERRAADATELTRRFREALRPVPGGAGGAGRAARVRRLERWLARCPR